LSERQACRLVGVSTNVLRYQPGEDGNQPLHERLKELTGQHRRHGYRTLRNRLRNGGWVESPQNQDEEKNKKARTNQIGLFVRP
jgi:hypothetical protein